MRAEYQFIEGNMSDQTKVTVTEDHGSWKKLSNGDVIVPGHGLWESPTVKTQAPKLTEGPRKVLRTEFDAMDHSQRWETVKSGAKIVDSLEVKPAPTPRGPGLTVRREAFDRMTETEKWAVMREVNRGDAQLVD
jgi:hypothetical protein